MLLSGAAPAAPRPRQVLFVCTANSARSILAEALTNHLGGGRVRAFSAGSFPAGTVNALALRELQALGVPTEGLRSKSWDEFAAAGAPALDIVITVCDNAAGEACPVWPGAPATAHWGLPDPAAVQGPPEARAQAFHATALALKRRIQLMLALPAHALDAPAMQRELRLIGTR